MDKQFHPEILEEQVEDRECCERTILMMLTSGKQRDSKKVMIRFMSRQLIEILINPVVEVQIDMSEEILLVIEEDPQDQTVILREENRVIIIIIEMIAIDVNTQVQVTIREVAAAMMIEEGREVIVETEVDIDQVIAIACINRGIGARTSKVCFRVVNSQETQI
jgi:hypothetical protein